MSDESGKDYDYLNEERKLLWKELRKTQEELAELQRVGSRDSDPEGAIRSLGYRAAVAYKNIMERTDILTKREENTRSGEAAVVSAVKKLAEMKASAEGSLVEIESSVNKLTELSEGLRESTSSASTMLNELTQGNSTLAEEQESLRDTIGKVAELAKSSKEQVDRVKEVHAEVLGVYRSIFGYTDEAGNLVEGKKTALEQSYKELTSSIFEIKTQIEESATSYKDRCDSFLEQSKSRVEALKAELESLMPGGVTAGLSAAYREKRENELKEHANGIKIFIKAIASLVVISSLPVLVGVIMLFKGKDLIEVFRLLPREALCFLPLYLPVLWVAVFANKRVNLSKRLIEEYTHKEVVSRTYEGLAKQINELGEESGVTDLRARLLYNTVMLSEKNPGELIKDYGKPDNPIINLLDRGSEFTDAMKSFESIPGLDKAIELLLAKKRNRSDAEDEDENE